MNQAYKKAGVDIEAGYEAVKRMRRHVDSTRRPEVLGNLGGFGGLFQLDMTRWKQPVLVSGTDGVGTKLKLAFEMDKHDSIGIDVVAMCVNDILVQGAEPLFFLDYLACDKVEPHKIEQIVSGVAAGCRAAGCALIGGETAEMPGLYQQGEYDIAGFAVGAVERDQLLDGSKVKPGDLLVGLASSGVHSNGFSLVRKLIAEAGLSLDAKLDLLQQATLGEVLLTPTRIYVALIQALRAEVTVHAMAHITGGGFLENIPRMLPAGMGAEITRAALPTLPIFTLLQQLGGLTERECFSTFNMGIGMVLAISETELERATQLLAQHNETLWVIGRVTTHEGEVTFDGKPLP